MISACAKAYEAISGKGFRNCEDSTMLKKVDADADHFLQKAILCAEFIKKYLYVRAGADGARGGLLRACYATRNADGSVEQL